LATRRFTHYFIWLGVVLLQLIMTQVVTYLFSILFPGGEAFPLNYPVLFVAILGISFSAGIFLPGWLAFRRGWLNGQPKNKERLVATLVGAYLPLLIGLILLHRLEPGSPFFLISILAGILGFYLPSWIKQ
jgi:hypothetical protein